MGACYDSFGCKAESDKDAIQRCFDYMEQCRWEDGHGGYSGTMADIYDVYMTDKVFNDVNDAHEWLNEEAEKRGPAMGVKVILPKGEYYLFGACCPS